MKPFTLLLLFVSLFSLGSIEAIRTGQKRPKSTSQDSTPTLTPEAEKTLETALDTAETAAGSIAASQPGKAARIKRFLKNAKELKSCALPWAATCDPQVIAELKADWKIGAAALGVGALAVLGALIYKFGGGKVAPTRELTDDEKKSFITQLSEKLDIGKDKNPQIDVVARRHSTEHPRDDSAQGMFFAAVINGLPDKVVKYMALVNNKVLTAGQELTERFLVRDWQSNWNNLTTILSDINNQLKNYSSNNADFIRATLSGWLGLVKARLCKDNSKPSGAAIKEALLQLKKKSGAVYDEIREFILNPACPR